MQAMTDLEELKTVIAATWRDEEMASSALFGVEAYAKLWPVVLTVNDWDVWDESGSDLRHDVRLWLSQQDFAWDFYRLLGTWGLVGFRDLRAATRFKLRWSGMLKTSSSNSAWNPHPLNSSFAPCPADEAAARDRGSRRAAR